MEQYFLDGGKDDSVKGYHTEQTLAGYNLVNYNF